jgi:hypothetical protein
MPTKLPPRRVPVPEENSDFSPLLGLVAGLLALVLVLAEARVISPPNAGQFVPPETALVVPF